MRTSQMTSQKFDTGPKSPASEGGSMNIKNKLGRNIKNRLGRAAAVAVASAAIGGLGLTGVASAATAASPLQGAGSCQNIDYVYQPQSAFPDTPRGRLDFLLQPTTIEKAVLCLVNAERTALNLQPLKRFIALRGTATLGTAAAREAADAVRLRWWGDVEPGKNCFPLKDNPSQCDPHINPQTLSTPVTRAQAVGYTRRCASYSIGENAYVGWGVSNVTPRAAVSWWMGSPPHRANILNPNFTESYAEPALGSADPAAGSTTPAVTYVQMFGRCS
jgi:uncharacterized protein YkwD